MWPSGRGTPIGAGADALRRGPGGRADGGRGGRLEPRAALVSGGHGSGWQIVTAEIEGFRDTLPGNNQAATTMFVSPPNRCASCRPTPPQAASLAAMLARVMPPGTDIVRQNVTQLPSRPEELAAVDLLFLVNVPAAELSAGQVDALERAVIRQGTGLIVTGGDRSFFAGGYAGGRLEQFSPVTSLESPSRTSRGWPWPW